MDLTVPTRLILASKSPRRRELIRALDVSVELGGSNGDEGPPRPGETPQQYVSRLSLEKARAAASGSDPAIVLGADTAVVIEPPAIVGDDTVISVLGCDLTDASFETNEAVTVDGVTATMSDGSAAPGVTVTSGSLQVSLDVPLPFYQWLRLDVDVTGQSSGQSATLTVFMGHTPLDINGDGRTNISDATAFGAEFNGAKDPNLIDVNCDGVVNISDATAFGNVWRDGANGAGPE